MLWIKYGINTETEPIIDRKNNYDGEGQRGRTPSANSSDTRVEFEQTRPVRLKPAKRGNAIHDRCLSAEGGWISYIRLEDDYFNKNLEFLSPDGCCQFRCVQLVLVMFVYRAGRVVA